jgi:hypothetical protein
MGMWLVRGLGRERAIADGEMARCEVRKRFFLKKEAKNFAL